jgi:hypothetical protein
MTASNSIISKKPKVVKENVTYRILQIIKESIKYK